MQHSEQVAAWSGGARKRAGMEAVVETLASRLGGGESLAELAHDARNMVTALGLYCDLLEQPGVLASSHRHFGSELRLVAAASHRLVEKMVALDLRSGSSGASDLQGIFRDAAAELPKRNPLEMRPRPMRQWEMLPAIPIEDMAGELMANRNLLAALAGPTIGLTVDAESGALPVWLTGEDLTRVLVNLVKNAAQAMPAGGQIILTLRERPAPNGSRETLLLWIEDSGPGIPPQALDKVFEAGFSTLAGLASSENWPASHRGLGLSITRSIIEAAGGRIGAASSDHGGARLSIELPVRRR
jgi:signal transduction histidine kinase